MTPVYRRKSGKFKPRRRFVTARDGMVRADTYTEHADARSPGSVEDPPVGEADRADRPGPRARPSSTRCSPSRRACPITASSRRGASSCSRARRGSRPARRSRAVFKADNPHATEDQIAFERNRLARAPLVVAVVSRAAPHVKIPEWEQVLSAGAAAMNLVTAAHALGFAANWITEWYAYDRARARCARAWREREDRGLRAYRHGRSSRRRIDRARRLPKSSRDTAVKARSISCSTTTDKPDHGLPHDPFKAIVAPRPIGWITSMSASGAINLAPYSYFNGVRSRPPW